jgi:ABC-2 type transport system permease protein
MSKTLLVAWGQIKKLALHWSFLLIVCYPPLLALIFGVYAVFLAGVANLEPGDDSQPAPGVIITNAVVFDQAVGLVDQGHLITLIPADLGSDNLLSFPSETAAQAAIQSGRIVGYYLIPADYIASGLVTYFSPDTVQFTETDEVIKKLLTLNLAEADGPGVARRLIEPVTFTPRQLTLAGRPPPNLPETYTAAEVGIGMGIALFVYLTIGSVCGTFLNQLAREREGRVLEVVLSALTPWQLLTGKFMGILVVGLIETGAWLFWVRVFGLVGAQLAATPAGGPLTPAAPTEPALFILSGIIYIGGYIAYTATAAALGALVTDTRQASRLNFMLVMVSLSPMVWLISVLTDRNGVLAVCLSLFPLSAPIMMPLRIFITAVPVWQLGLCLLGLLTWTALMLRLAARLFQAQLLLNDTPLGQLLPKQIKTFWRKTSNV